MEHVVEVLEALLAEIKKSQVVKTVKNGMICYRLNGELHREDGPAVEYLNGSREYCINGKLHREGGPAVEKADGYKAYYINDKRHRIDGPATIYSDSKKYYIEGKEYNRCDFLKHELVVEYMMNKISASI